MPKELSDLQKKFLFHLFDGDMDPYEAKKLAGYSGATTLKEVTEGLKEEISEGMKSYLALHGPMAIKELVQALKDVAPNGNKLKAIEMVLNRIGMSDKQSEIDLKVPSGGLFILPAKKAREYGVVDIDTSDKDE